MIRVLYLYRMRKWKHIVDKETNIQFELNVSRGKTSCMFLISAFDFDIYMYDINVFHSVLIFRKQQQKGEQCLVLQTIIVGFMKRVFCHSLVATVQQTALFWLAPDPLFLDLPPTESAVN